MSEKPYQWAQGAVLEDHSRRKHKILREYLAEYLRVRCRIGRMERFRLAIVDGFAGGGRYVCGSAGSPVIFIEVLRQAVLDVNGWRAAQGLGPIEIECLLILNDLDRAALEQLKANVAPLLAEITQNVPSLHLRTEFFNASFEEVYPRIRELLERGRFRNVLFNLDQCGYTRVSRETLTDIMRGYRSVEIFYTFMVGALLTYLQASNPQRLSEQLAPFGIAEADIRDLGAGLSKPLWLGAAERLVFETFRECGAYVSPFSINNPDGWRYWMIHFANSHRARQVYNDVLHANSSEQAHFGRSGLNMLAYDPRHEGGSLYLFDVSGRARAHQELVGDIPRLVAEYGDAMAVGEFYADIYNATPAHSDDIHKAMIDSRDIEIITAAGGERRSARTIDPGDLIKLKPQRSFFPIFPA